jgi:hypothetical protein
MGPDWLKVLEIEFGCSGRFVCTTESKLVQVIGYVFDGISSLSFLSENINVIIK